MVHYIRLLKPPALAPKNTVHALITITTDLGESFYPSALPIHTKIISSTWQSSWHTFQWQSGMRSLTIEVPDVTKPRTPETLQLIVSTTQDGEGDGIVNVTAHGMPEVMSLWSDAFGTRRAGGVVERRYRTEEGCERSILEEVGEGIASHIWDAGIALAGFLSHIIALTPNPPSALAPLLRSSSGPKVLELGSGCGIVGLHIAGLCPASDVLLTDLPHAMDILNLNVARAKSLSKQSKIATASLDWDEAFPDAIDQQRFDIMVVSDCTYNSDRIPGLVKTLAAVVEKSPAALIVVALKVRHDSEAVFFELMATAGMTEFEHVAIPLPDRHRSGTGQALEVVDVYVYGKRTAGQDSRTV